MKVDDSFLLQRLSEHHQSESMIRMGAFEPKSYVAGPGARAILWVTGCNRRCPGCIKPEFLPFNAGQLQSIEEIASKILACKSISGVSYSGGEPFEQAIALGELSRILKASGLNILSYTGFRLEALQENPTKFGALLEQVDWLIDGEFRDDLPGPFQYRGSENQRLLKKELDGSFSVQPTEKNHDVQVTLTSKGIRFTGFPNSSFERDFKKALAARGINLHPESVESDTPQK